MDKQELQRLRDLPIEGVAERLGLSVNSRHKCLCPFHDDHHASMSFHRGRNTFRCFVCGAHGGTIDLVMQYQRMDFKEACRWLNPLTPSLSIPEGKGSKYQANNTPPLRGGREGLGGREGVDFYARFFEHPWLSDEARRFLFAERRLDERVVRWCRLTSWRDKHGINWLQIPYYDREWKLIGTQNRNLNPSPNSPRFRFPQGSHCGIYNLPVLNLLHDGDELWITEGCSDCWAMLSSGRKAIAIPSATLLMPKDKQLLSTLYSQLSTQFHMYPDRDAPGERLFLQLKDILPTLQHHQLPLGCKDFGEMFTSQSPCDYVSIVSRT